MDENDVLCALIGLSGALNNNGKTKNTDMVTAMAIVSSDYETAVEHIHQEKFQISPGCATCMNPCGNTSDADKESLKLDDPDTGNLKKEIYKELKIIAQNFLNKKEKDDKNPEIELPEVFYRGISYIGYDVSAVSYEKLLKEIIDVKTGNSY